MGRGEKRRLSLGRPELGAQPLPGATPRKPLPQTSAPPGRDRKLGTGSAGCWDLRADGGVVPETGPVFNGGRGGAACVGVLTRRKPKSSEPRSGHHQSGRPERDDRVNEMCPGATTQLGNRGRLFSVEYCVEFYASPHKFALLSCLGSLEINLI